MVFVVLSSVAFAVIVRILLGAQFLEFEKTIHGEPVGPPHVPEEHYVVSDTPRQTEQEESPPPTLPPLGWLESSYPDSFPEPELIHHQSFAGPPSIQ